MTKDYWYILHIPTGTPLQYFNKRFSRKEYKERLAEEREAHELRIAKLEATIGTPTVVSWDLKTYSPRSVNSIVVANCAFGSTKEHHFSDPEIYLGEITAKYFNTFIDIKRSNSIIKFADELDARDFLNYIYTFSCLDAYIETHDANEFTLVSSTGKISEYVAKKNKDAIRS